MNDEGLIGLYLSFSGQIIEPNAPMGAVVEELDRSGVFRGGNLELNGAESAEIWRRIEMNAALAWRGEVEGDGVDRGPLRRLKSLGCLGHLNFARPHTRDGSVEG